MERSKTNFPFCFLPSIYPKKKYNPIVLTTNQTKEEVKKKYIFLFLFLFFFFTKLYIIRSFLIIIWTMVIIIILFV